MGLSGSTARANVEVNQSTVQQFGGSCDFKCDNKISGVNVDLVNTYLSGGIKITQICSTDATCSISTNVDAISDVYTKATASSNAKNIDSFFPGIDVSSSSSKTSINNYIGQQVYDDCKVESSNDIRDVDIFAANSYITGGILIGQAGYTRGNCTFDTIMSAVADSTAQANASSLSGKDKKGEKCGSCSGAEVVITYIAIGIAVIVALGLAAWAIKYFMSRSSTTTTGSENPSPTSFLDKIKSSFSAIPTKTPTLASLAEI